MRLFFYYAFCSVKNQIRKLFRSWVAILIAACLGFGLIIGIGVGAVATLFEEEIEEEEPAEEIPAEELPEEELPEEARDAILGFICGGIVLAVLLLNVIRADKNGASIFLMADVNLLFSAPMKPQSVLLFRLMAQLFLSFFASIYLIFQLPNLIINVGLHPFTAAMLLAVWILTMVVGKLLNVLLYSVSSTYPAVKKYIRPALYGLLLLAAGGFLLYWKGSGLPVLDAATAYFNGPVSDWVPLWGWLRGIVMTAARQEYWKTGILLLLTVGTSVLLGWFIWHIRVDFYEDAMAKSQETAERTAAMQGKTQPARKKERADRYRRDGLTFGSGARMFFCKSVYNRFRFATLGVFTKTGITYLFLAVAVALFLRLGPHMDFFPAVGVLLAVCAFFRSMGNPLAQEVEKVYFTTVPANPWAKVIWSLLGGSLDCALDVLPATVVAALLLRASPMQAIAFFLLAVAVDFYAANVMLFIELSLPTSVALQLKQSLTVLFVYFGILPIAGIVIVGALLGFLTLAIFVAAFAGLAVGGVFYAFSPMFLQYGRK